MSEKGGAPIGASFSALEKNTSPLDPGGFDMLL